MSRAASLSWLCQQERLCWPKCTSTSTPQLHASSAQQPPSRQAFTPVPGLPAEHCSINRRTVPGAAGGVQAGVEPPAGYSWGLGGTAGLPVGSDREFSWVLCLDLQLGCNRHGGWIQGMSYVQDCSLFCNCISVICLWCSLYQPVVCFDREGS